MLHVKNAHANFGWLALAGDMPQRIIKEAQAQMPNKVAAGGLSPSDAREDSYQKPNRDGKNPRICLLCRWPST
jgi:hypothetical protein